MLKLKYMKGEEFVKKILEGERDFSKVKLEEGFELTRYGKLYKELSDYLYECGEKEFKENPIRLDDSEFIGFKAGDYYSKLYLPFAKGNRANFKESNLSYADFSDGEFEKAYFGKAKMHNIRFWGANLKDARLEDTDIQGACFYEANLENAVFWNADLEHANFNNADLKGASLSNARLYKARLVKANLEDTDLNNANCSSAFFKGANLKGAKLAYTYFGSADLKHVKNLKGAKSLGYAIFNKTKVGLKERAIIKKALSKKISFVIEDYD